VTSFAVVRQANEATPISAHSKLSPTAIQPRNPRGQPHGTVSPSVATNLPSTVFALRALRHSFHQQAVSAVKSTRQVMLMNMKRPSRIKSAWMARACAVLLALAPLTGHATVLQFCVATQAQLDGAMQSAALLSFIPHVIRIKTGSYQLVNPIAPVSYEYYQAIPIAPLQLLGGYNADCSVRSVNPLNTLLDNIQIVAPLAPQGDVLIEGVTITDQGLKFAVREIDDVDIELRSNILRDAYAGSFMNVDEDIYPTLARQLFLFYYTGSNNGHVRLINNLSYNIDNLGSGGSMFRLISRAAVGHNVPDDDIGLFVANNTVIQGDDAVTAAIENNGWAPAYYYNNVFVPTDPGGAGYTGFGIRNGYGDTVVSNNLYGSCDCNDANHEHINMANVIITSLGDAGFVDAPTSNYRMLPNSLAVNSGNTGILTSLPFRDLDGAPRLSGSSVDRGAYEFSTSNAAGVVTNTNDSGAGSLRAAITSTNSSGSIDKIVFSIPGTCPRTIALASPLPLITDTLLIDGFSQPGSSPNSLDRGNNAKLCVLLKSSGATYALGVNSASAQLTAQGLGFGGFGNEAMLLIDGTGHIVRGNQFGDSVTGPGGTVVLPANTYGVLIGLGARATIGGIDAASRNVFADSTQAGVFLGSSANFVQNNFIGLTASGSFAAPNTTGVYSSAANNVVLDNFIAGNTDDGVKLGNGATGNIVFGNTIGEKAVGLCFPLPCQPDYSMPNGGNGIAVDGDSSNNKVYNNLIAHNGADGVRVASGTGNRIQNNRIDDNVEQGIDIAAAGFTANDDDADPNADNLGNRGQNFPVIEQASGVDAAGSVRGSLTSRAGQYEIDVYLTNICILGNLAEGARRVGHANMTIVSPSATGIGGFVVNVADSEGLLNRYLTATATDAFGNTSEFGNCVRFTDRIFADGFEAP
jgi:parallel beta-helix repeat protein